MTSSLVMIAPIIPRVGDMLVCCPKVNGLFPVVKQVLLFPTKDYLNKINLPGNNYPNNDYVAIVFAE
jgi:hypothetical protein